MPSHIGGEDAADHPFAHLLEVVAAERLEYVAILVFQDPEGDAAVMVLQG